MQKEYLIENRAVADEKGTLLNLKYYLIEEEQLPYVFWKSWMIS